MNHILRYTFFASECSHLFGAILVCTKPGLLDFLCHEVLVQTPHQSRNRATIDVDWPNSECSHGQLEDSLLTTCSS
jgi:hypothetical protein